jgi:hypothetical protein
MIYGAILDSHKQKSGHCSRIFVMLRLQSLMLNSSQGQRQQPYLGYWDFAASALRPMKHAKIKGSNYTSGSMNLLLHRSSGVFFIHEEINCIYSK